MNGALRAFFADVGDVQKLRQLNATYDFEVPSFEPQTMRESLMKRVLESAVSNKIDEHMHPRAQLEHWANREGEALTRVLLAGDKVATSTNPPFDISVRFKFFVLSELFSSSSVLISFDF